MAFSFWAWLGRGPAMCEVVWVGVRGGEQFAWAAFRGRGGWALVSFGVCGGCGRATGWGGRAAGRGAPLGCGGCWGRRVGVWRACAGVPAGGGGPCRGARGCARWWACVAPRLSSERGEAWAGIVRWGVLCRCMCPLAAARLRGQL